jgi:hypothetical protein
MSPPQRCELHFAWPAAVPASRYSSDSNDLSWLFRGGLAGLIELGSCGDLLKSFDRRSVQPEGAMRSPFQHLHLANTSKMVRVLSCDVLCFAETRRQHNINSERPVCSRSGKKQSSSPMLIIQPLPVLFVMALLVCFFVGQGSGKYDIPHA